MTTYFLRHTAPSFSMDAISDDILGAAWYGLGSVGGLIGTVMLWMNTMLGGFALFTNSF